ncbi:hypothetical protein V6N11_079765 [Hibiscus sabdariffa]|uniref:Uncharacterized protein n=1 Tax=Hibiscus sabdariffa TaxID=183260 RepID=A0ABR2RWQ2_9ROSI
MWYKLKEVVADQFQIIFAKKHSPKVRALRNSSENLYMILHHPHSSENLYMILHHPHAKKLVGNDWFVHGPCFCRRDRDSKDDLDQKTNSRGYDSGLNL